MPLGRSTSEPPWAQEKPSQLGSNLSRFSDNSARTAESGYQDYEVKEWFWD